MIDQQKKKETICFNKDELVHTKYTVQCLGFGILHILFTYTILCNVFSLRYKWSGSSTEGPFIYGTLIYLLLVMVTLG